MWFVMPSRSGRGEHVPTTIKVKWEPSWLTILCRYLGQLARRGMNGAVGMKRSSMLTWLGKLR